MTRKERFHHLSNFLKMDDVRNYTRTFDMERKRYEILVAVPMVDPQGIHWLDLMVLPIILLTFTHGSLLVLM